MRVMGILVAACAALALVWGMTIDTTVDGGPLVGRVSNLQLMSEKQNLLLFSGLFLIAGVLLAIFGRSGSTRECPACAETIKAEASRCRYCQAEVEPVEGKRDSTGMLAMWAVGAVVAIGALIVFAQNQREADMALEELSASIAEGTARREAAEAARREGR